MFNKKIKELEVRKKLREIDLMVMHDTPCDPIIGEIYKSNVLVDIMHIENEIEFEKAMKPFKYMLLGFTVVSSLLLMWDIIKKYM